MNFKHILIFSFSHIGDAVLSTAVIDPLQNHFPNARISILVGPGAQEIFQGDKRFDDIIIYDNRGSHAGLSGRIRLVRELKAKGFDLVVDLRDSFWSHFIGGVRWGTQFRMRSRHNVDRYLGILRAQGIETENAMPGVYIPPLMADDFNHDIVIGIHPGGGWQYKLWPVERFATLVDLVNKEYDAKVLVFAGPDEVALQRRIAELTKSSPILVKDIGLKGLAALIQRCHVYIGNDTGPMHIAAAVGTRVIAMFGPTDARRIGPYGNGHIVIAGQTKCSPCHPGPRPGRCKLGRCPAIESISVDQVAGAVERILHDER